MDLDDYDTRSPGEAADFSVATTTEGDDLVVRVAGEVDLATGPKLREVLDEALERGTGRIVVDLAGTTLLDSTGLSVLLAVHRRLTGSGRALVLRTPARAVRATLDVTGVSRVLSVEG